MLLLISEQYVTIFYRIRFLQDILNKIKTVSLSILYKNIAFVIKNLEEKLPEVRGKSRKQEEHK